MSRTKRKVQIKTGKKEEDWRSGMQIGGSRLKLLERHCTDLSFERKGRAQFGGNQEKR